MTARYPSDDDSSSFDCDMPPPPGLHPYQFEPSDEEADDIFNPQPEMPEPGIPVKEWCTCGYCQDMPTKTECVCCRNHDAQFKLSDRGEEYRCIHLHPGVVELIQIAPLEIAWANYRLYHQDVFPDGEPTPNARKRLCSYRNLIFWIFPTIQRKERKPLPSCLVNFIRNYHAPTDDEEVFADYRFKGFCWGDED